MSKRYLCQGQVHITTHKNAKIINIAHHLIHQKLKYQLLKFKKRNMAQAHISPNTIKISISKILTKVMFSHRKYQDSLKMNKKKI